MRSMCQLVRTLSSQFNIRYSSYYPDVASKKIRRHAPSWDGSEWESCQSSSKKVRCALQQSVLCRLQQTDRGARLQEELSRADSHTSKIPDTGVSGVQMPGRITLRGCAQC